MTKNELYQIAYNFVSILFSVETETKSLELISDDLQIIHSIDNEKSFYNKDDFEVLLEDLYLPLIHKYNPSKFKAYKFINNTIEFSSQINKKIYKCEFQISITVEENSGKVKTLETAIIKEVLDIPGGLLSFSVNPDLYLTTVTSDFVSFLGYSNKSELIDSLGGKFSNSMNKDDLKLLLSTIETKKTKSRHFTINLRIKDKTNTFRKMYLEGQIIQFEDHREEVFARLILSELIEDDVDFYDSLEDQFTEIVQNYPIPIFYKNTKGIYQLINLAYIKEFELQNLNKMIFHSDSEFFEFEANKFIKSDVQILNKEIAYSESINYISIENKKFYCRTYKIPTFNKKGITGIIGFVSNISKEKEYKEQLEMKDIETNYIFQNSESPYYIKDKDLRFVKVNAKFCEIFHAREEDILHKRMEDFLPSYVVDPKKPLDLKALKLNKGEFIKEIIEFDLFNTLKYFEIKITPMFDEKGEIYRLIGKLEDITQKVENQNRLIKSYNLELDKTYSKKSFDYIRIDLKTGSILFSKRTMRLHSTKFYNDKLIDDFRDAFLYDFEFETYKKKYSLDAIRRNFGKKKSPSNFAILINQEALRLEINLEYYTSPTTRHEEAVIYIRDISKSIENRELIELFSKVEFDFIVKLSFLSKYAMAKYNNGNELEFEHLKKDHKIETFLSILYKDSVLPVPTVKEWHHLVNKLLSEKKHNTYFIETNSDSRKNITLKLVNKRRQTILVACQDFTEATKKDREIQKQLRAMAQQSQKADNIKTEFLSRMSHDMRTPLTAIIGLSEFGIEESKEKLSINYFNKIKTSSQYLSVLLNDVLEIQKIESGEIKLNNLPFYLPDTAEQIKTMVHPRTIEKNIEFNLVPINLDDGPFYVYNDEVRMSEILVNILNNSIKYTPRGGKITWTFEIKRNPLILRNVIEDNGIGMSKEFQEQMFNKYTQEQNIFSGAEGGSGLGLSIVKNLVNLVGGTIECKSKLNVGTTFIIDLPLKETTKSEFEKYNVKKSDIEFGRLSGTTILVCEDTKINTIIIGKILSKYNAKIEIAENGLRGVEMAKTYNYDAILMDIRMPVMNGLEAAQEIRKFNINVPIIALSANAYKEDIDKSLAAGMNAHLSKPINSEKLYSTLSFNLRKNP